MTQAVASPFDAPTPSGAVQPPANDAGPPETPIDDTPAWKRATTREEALQALLDDEELPLDAVTKHQRVSGVIGTHAKRLSQQQLREQEQQAREQRRRDLAANGRTAELGQEVAGDYVSDPTTQARDQATQALTAEAQKELGEIFSGLPKDAQERLSERASDGVYNGAFGVGLRTWTADVIAETVAAELPKALEKEIKKRDLIPRTVAEAERVNGLGSPDVRRGGSSGAADWETEIEMAAELAPLLAAGDREATAQMTQWYRRHRR